MKPLAAILATTLIVLPVSFAFAQDTPPEDTVSLSEARAIHDALLTIDTHVDIGTGYATSALAPGGFTRAQVDLPKMRAGGLDAGFFIVYTAQGTLDEAGYDKAHQAAEAKYHAIDRMVRGYPDQIALARTADDVVKINGSGRLVALIGIENAYPLGETIDEVPLWAKRGAR